MSISCDEALNAAGFGWFQIRLCLLCSMGYFAVCSELISMVMAQSGLKTSFGITSALQFSWLPFSANLASFFASIIVGKWADSSGRRIPFIVSLLVSSVFGVASAFAPSFVWLIVFRSIAGFGLGGLTVVDYIVLVECTPRTWRNLSAQLVFVAGCLGVVYIAILGLFPLDSISSSIPAWRVLMFLGALPLIITVVIRFCVGTDTPQYLLAKGNAAEAQVLLDQIELTNKSLPALHWVVPDNDRTDEEEVNEQGDITQVLRAPHTIPLAGVWIIQSLVYWGLTIFLPRVLKAAGIGNASLGLFFMGVAELPGVVLATLAATQFGRPRAILACQAFSVFGAVITGFTTMFQLPGGVGLLGGSMFYMFLIPIWGLLFVLTPESYPVATRGAATGFHHMCKGVPSLLAPFLAASIIESEFANSFMFIWAGLLCLGIACTVWLSNVFPKQHYEISKDNVVKTVF